MAKSAQTGYVSLGVRFFIKVVKSFWNFFPQSLGQINEACQFSEFLEAIYYPPGAWTFFNRRRQMDIAANL